MNDELIASIQTLGKSKGLNNAQINKAIKMIQSGKINTDDLIDNMVDSSVNSINVSNPSREDLREKLHKKIESEKNRRLHKITTNKETKPEIQQQNPTSNNIKKKILNRKKKEAKKLNKLQQKYGTITLELYNKCLSQLQSYGPTCHYSPQEISNYSHCQNIVDLYLKQQKTNENATTDINIDVSDLSDLSDDD